MAVVGINYKLALRIATQFRVAMRLGIHGSAMFFLVALVWGLAEDGQTKLPGARSTGRFRP